MGGGGGGGKRGRRSQWVIRSVQTLPKFQAKVFLAQFHIRPAKIHITNFLLTEREGRTGEYWPEVVAVQTERSEVRTKTTKGQYSPVRLELARLVSSLLYGFLISFCLVFASP